MRSIWQAAAAWALLVVGLLAGPAQAQTAAQTEWPQRPVKVVIPFTPGSGTDFIIRGMAERLSKQLGQQFVVEHRSGASGTLGAESVARSAADGYTLLMGPQSPLIVLPSLRKVPYDPMKDFIGVDYIGEVIAGFAVPASLGVKNLQEFIALAKKKPGQLTFVSAGVGSINHLRGETLKLMAGIDLTHVPYRGNGEALPDLLSGQVQGMFDSLVFPHVKSGKLTLIAILADQRFSEFPDVPTMKEQGLPEFDLPIWFGAWFPAGVPMPIVEKLHAAMASAHTDEEFRAKQFAAGIWVYSKQDTLAEFRARQEKQIAFFADIIKRAKVTLD